MGKCFSRDNKKYPVNEDTLDQHERDLQSVTSYPDPEHDRNSRPPRSDTIQETCTASSAQPIGTCNEKQITNVTTMNQTVHSKPPVSGQHMVLSDKFLQDVSSNLGFDWRLLFVSIGLTMAELDQIDYDRGFDQPTKNLKAFLLWRQNHQHLCASEQLQNILDGFKEIHRQDVVDKYGNFMEESKLSTISVMESNEKELLDLKQRLIEINNGFAKKIKMSGMQDRGNEIPIELLFASVIIRGERKVEKNQHMSEIPDLSDIFIQNDRLVRNIFLLGDAAHGKTTFCLWILRQWCKLQQKDDSVSDLTEEKIKSLCYFHFVFLLQLRNVNQNRFSVIDMITLDIFGRDKSNHAMIQKVLSSEKYRSLIIVDGLDEWNPNEEARRQLTCKGMPNIEDVSSTVTCLFSMRPWVFPTLSKMIKLTDNVLEIHGLTSTGMERVVENVLVHHYNIEKGTQRYTDTYNKIVGNLDGSLKSFMQIPLLAVVCVQIWYEDRQSGDNMSTFYAAMIDMLIERARQKHELKIEVEKAVDCCLPECLSENVNIATCISLLLKLGKIAYEGLLSHETILVFQKRKLEHEVGEIEYQFALHIGLISENEETSIIKKNVSIHFFHKSIQEFLAVILIVTQKDVMDSFFKHLSNVTHINELSNVMMFICGMCPSLVSSLTQRVVSVTDDDKEISNYRSHCLSQYMYNTRVEALYDVQLNMYNQLHFGKNDYPVEFYISDVYLRYIQKKERVLLTKKLLIDPHVHIKSLQFSMVSTDKDGGITNDELNNYLRTPELTMSLVMLNIFGNLTDRCLGTICGANLKILCIDSVELATGGSPLLMDMPHLQNLRLMYVSLGDMHIGVTSEMKHLTDLYLKEVNMTGEGWKINLQSLSNLDHMFNVKILYSNLDQASRTRILKSPNYNVTVNKDWLIHFTRIVNLWGYQEDDFDMDIDQGYADKLDCGGAEILDQTDSQINDDGYRQIGNDDCQKHKRINECGECTLVCSGVEAFRGNEKLSSVRVQTNNDSCDDDDENFSYHDYENIYGDPGWVIGQINESVLGNGNVDNNDGCEKKDESIDEYYLYEILRFSKEEDHVYTSLNFEGV